MLGGVNDRKMSARIKSRVQSIFASSPFLKHVMTLVSGTVVAQVIVFFMMMVITRFYAPEVMGEFAAFMSVTAIIVSVAAGRYDMALMLERDDEAAKMVARIAFSIICGTALVAILAALLLRSFFASNFSDATAKWMPLVGLCTIFMAGAALLQYWYNRKTDYKTIAINRVVQQVGTSGGQVAIGGFGFTALPGLILGQLIGQAYAFFNLMIRAKELRAPVQKGNLSYRGLVKKHWRMPVLNAPNVLVDALRTNGINLLIGGASVASLGQFNLANQAMYAPVALVNAAISQVFFQKLATAKRGRMAYEVKNSIKRSLQLGMVPFALLWVLAPWLMPIVFGAQWQESGYFARAIVPWMMVVIVSAPVSTVFIVTGKQLWSLIHSIVYCVVPLGWLWLSPYSLLTTVFGLGIINACFLSVSVVMAYLAAKYFDKANEKEETEYSN